MIDREKVIEGLNTCAHPPLGRFCKGCPYYENANCSIDLMSDALALLKEQDDEFKELWSIVEFWKEKALHT